MKPKMSNKIRGAGGRQRFGGDNFELYDDEEEEGAQKSMTAEPIKDQPAQKSADVNLNQNGCNITGQVINNHNNINVFCVLGGTTANENSEAAAVTKSLQSITSLGEKIKNVMAAHISSTTSQ